MATFVHLTGEDRVKLIERNGISLGKRKISTEIPRGIFAMPVTPDFYISHQWLRELRRKNSRIICGVYFRIDDKELVYLGHYNQNHQRMTAAEAIATIMQAKTEGFEVIIPRKIVAKEIQKTKILTQLVGWRYYPGAKGREPCGCSYCQRGDYGAKKLREKYEQDSE